MNGRQQMREALAQFGLLEDEKTPTPYWHSMPIDEETIGGTIQHMAEDPKYQDMMDVHFDKVKKELLKLMHRFGFSGRMYDEEVLAFVNSLFPLRQTDKEIEESKMRSDKRDYIAKQIARRLEERQYKKSIHDLNALIDIMLLMIPGE